jgi:glycosyltransferase involved in cell wall biosynthesis
MRVLLIGAFPPAGSPVKGGQVTSCQALMASSLPDRVALTLIDTTQRSVPAPPIAVRAWDAIRRVVAVVARIERDRPDVLFAFAGPGLSYLEKGLCAVYARRRGVAGLVSVRGGELVSECQRSPLWRAVVRAIAQRVSAIVCQGPTWQRFFAGELGVPVSRLPVVENWTASAELLAIGRDRIYRADTDRLHLVLVGWLAESKGIRELAAAFARVRASRPGTRLTLTIAGDGEMMPEVRRWATEHGFVSDVAVPGWLDAASREQALRDADAFVLPSWYEGLPNAMIEAMAAGLPVIVTPVGTIPDVVVDGETGLLVPVRDVAALARAVERMIDEPAMRAAMGRAAHALAAERFGLERAVDGLIAVFERAREERR